MDLTARRTADAGLEYLSGKLDIEGDRAKALQLSSVIDIPQPR